MNRTRARDLDDFVELDPQKKQKVMGSGAWKHLAPDAACELIFSHPTDTIRALARKFKRSPTYCQDIIHMGSQMLKDKQAEATTKK